MYETKIVIVVKDELLPWQKLNVVAFLASAVAIEFPETHGKKLIDQTKIEYLPFIKHPMMIYKASSTEELKRVYRRAKDRELAIGIYTQPLFATKNEEQNLAEIKGHAEDDQDYVGLVFYGDRKKIDKAVKGLTLHD